MNTIINKIQARHDKDKIVRKAWERRFMDIHDDRQKLLDIIRDIEANLTCCEYRVCKCCNHVQAILNRTEP